MIGQWLTRRREAAASAYIAACGADRAAFSHPAVLAASHRLARADLALDLWTWLPRHLTRKEDR